MKIGIVGSGFVGATSAYALIMRGIGRKIVLVDKNPKRALAEAEDLFHAVPFASPLEVIAGDFSDLADAKVVIIAAGAAQRPGETRLDLLTRNATIFRELVPNILKWTPETILVIATNPVDVMTYLAAKYAKGYGIPPSRVIGSGTTLDTARFRILLGKHLGVDPHHVHAYVVGEHGDSEVLIWSLVTIGGMRLERFCEWRQRYLSIDDKRRIDKQVRRAAYSIIEGKGATYYGIGSAIAKITQSILYDQRAILTITTPTEEVTGIKDVSVSLPRLLGGDGVLATFPLPFSPEEEDAVNRSAQVVRSAIDELENHVLNRL